MRSGVGGGKHVVRHVPQREAAVEAGIETVMAELVPEEPRSSEYATILGELI